MQKVTRMKIAWLASYDPTSILLRRLLLAESSHRV